MCCNPCAPRQVSVGCVERGALLAQLWSAHGVLLQAALQDRQVAWAQQAAAQQATAAAVSEQLRLQQHQEDERVALRAINERHAAKADAARQEYDKLKQQHDNVCWWKVNSCRQGGVKHPAFFVAKWHLYIIGGWGKALSLSRCKFPHSHTCFCRLFCCMLVSPSSAPGAAKALEWSSAAGSAGAGSGVLTPAAGLHHTAAASSTGHHKAAAGDNVQPADTLAGQSPDSRGRGAASDTAAGLQHTTAQAGPGAAVRPCGASAAAAD